MKKFSEYINESDELKEGQVWEQKKSNYKKATPQQLIKRDQELIDPKRKNVNSVISKVSATSGADGGGQ